MECTLQVGDKVTLIDEYPWDWHHPNEPVFGVVYTVRDVVLETDGIGLLFDEISNMPQEYNDAVGEATFDYKEFRRVIDTTVTVAALAQAMREAMKKGRVDA